jgi:two-component system response regulator (stage 0 sporulation protein F)
VPAQAMPLSGRKILVADDQPTVRAVLEEILTQAGAETWMAEDGQVVLQLIEKDSPDLIMLDLRMPGMDGWAVLDHLGSRSETRRIPVILETVAGDLESFEKAKRHGVAAFISKPFRLNEVVEMCRRVLEGARPFQGTAARADSMARLDVRTPGGNLLTSGTLLQRESNGALGELSYPLTLGENVMLIFPDGERIKAEVRWISLVGERYCHGFMLSTKSQ